METDVLIIGAGLAGSVAALKAAQAGADVVVLQRGDAPDTANTYWAQGGIIYTAPGDSPDLLYDDILRAGAGITRPEAARLLAEEGPRRVREVLMEELGVAFDRRDDGAWDTTEEGAHSVARIVHCEDRTGQSISAALERALDAHPRITRLERWTAVDLLTLSHHSRQPLDIYPPNTCVGIYALDCDAKRVETILARETVLATGGLGELFMHSTNPPGARGDGIAMAYRAGARLLNLEYVQFHPTALYRPPERRMLLSESMRGEGARLLLSDGSEFMNRYHRQGSLAPRDVVARAIHEELLTRGEPCVYLDITHRPAEWVRERFPFIDGECRRLGLDITREPIPVVPAAHYSCGGVATDLEGRTTIERLRAVGEVACTGVHGANRLASTSLLEALVLGCRTAESIARRLNDEGRREAFPPIDPWVAEREGTDPALILQDWLSIKLTMWNYVGLARTQKRMKRALQSLRELQEEVEEFYAQARLSDELIGLRNGVQAALAVLYAARENHTSRGCHYLADQT